MIDEDGFRLNVGIILVNSKGQLLWARRIAPKNAWQFPQGGLRENETPKEAMYRELQEELGLLPQDVGIIAETKDWLAYHLPYRFRRYDSQPVCIGQKQKWFLLKLLSDESHIQLDNSENPEFDQWVWVSYWHPLEHVISFKRSVYKQVLHEFEPYVSEIEKSYE